MVLDEIRKKIDEVDRRLVELLDERAGLVQKIAHEKRKDGRDVYDASRESSVLRMALGRRKVFPAETLGDVFRKIIQASRALEEPMRIGFFGPEGTYTHEAALAIFGTEVGYVPRSSIPELFEMVDRGDIHYAVVPFENTTEGIVTHTIDMFNDHDLTINSQYYLRITQNLLTKERSLGSIRTVYSHRQALGQTVEWVRSFLPKVRVCETATTAEAARIAARRKGAAAIGSEAAARLYGLKILKKSIEDVEENFTRFLVIAKTNNNSPTGSDKTSILFTLKDEPGALHRILSCLAASGINMTKIESRPYKGRPWEYFFFVDLSGHKDDARIRAALEELKKMTIDLKILGSYPDMESKKG